MRLPRIMGALLLAALCVGAACAVPAQPPSGSPPAPRPQLAPGLEPHPGARLPLDARFVDTAGRTVRLGSYFGATPVLLVLGYYHCPNLCSTQMDSVLQGLAALGLAPAQARVLAVSIDPAEGPALAARKRAGYLRLLGGAQVPLELLTGAAPAIDRLVGAIGFHYAYDAAQRQYVHPAGFLVATADGKISRYVPGVGFQPRDLRLALLQAKAGAAVTLGERIDLLCAHFSQLTGRYPGLAWNSVRAASLLVLALLAGGVWRLSRQPGRRG